MTDRFLFIPADCSLPTQWITQNDGETVNSMIHRYIDCDLFEIVPLPISNLILIVDECGKLKSHDVNQLASKLYPGTPYGDYIAGDVIIGRIGLVQTDVIDGESFFEHDILPLRPHEEDVFVKLGWIQKEDP